LKKNQRLQSLVNELNELVKKYRKEMKILKKMESRARTWAQLTPVARALFQNEEKKKNVQNSSRTTIKRSLISLFVVVSAV